MPIDIDYSPPVTTSPGSSVLLALCQRRGVPLAVVDRHGELRIVRDADDLPGQDGAAT